MSGFFGWRDNSARVLALLGSLSAAAIVFGAATTASPGSAAASHADASRKKASDRGVSEGDGSRAAHPRADGSIPGRASVAGPRSWRQPASDSDGGEGLSAGEATGDAGGARREARRFTPASRSGDTPGAGCGRSVGKRHRQRRHLSTRSDRCDRRRSNCRRRQQHVQRLQSAGRRAAE